MYENREQLITLRRALHDVIVQMTSSARRADMAAFVTASEEFDSVRLALHEEEARQSRETSTTAAAGSARPSGAAAVVGR